jgi:hypothetical protein
MSAAGDGAGRWADLALDARRHDAAEEPPLGRGDEEKGTLPLLLLEAMDAKRRCLLCL